MGGVRSRGRYSVEVRGEREPGMAKLTAIRKTKARFEGHRLPDESHAYIDGCPELERPAAAGAAASEMTKRGTEVDAKLVLGTTTAARARTLRKHDLRERDQRGGCYYTTHEFTHYRTLQ